MGVHLFRFSLLSKKSIRGLRFFGEVGKLISPFLIVELNLNEVP